MGFFDKFKKKETEIKKELPKSEYYFPIGEDEEVAVFDIIILQCPIAADHIYAYSAAVTHCV